MRKHEIKILKLCLGGATAALVFFIWLGCYVFYKKYHFIDRGKIVAKINGYSIYEKDVRARLKSLSDSDIQIENAGGEILKAILLENYLNNKIFNLAKKKSDLNDLKFLKEDYYKRLATQYYLENFVFSGIAEEDIRKRYGELVKSLDGKEEREIYHILLATEDEARRVYNQALRGGDFDSIAKRRSLDKASAIRGGNIGYVIKEELTIPEFADIVFLLREGEISKPIETKEGWHVVKINNIRTMSAKSYEDSREEILKNLRREKYEEFLRELGVEEAERNIVILDGRVNIGKPAVDDINNLMENLDEQGGEGDSENEERQQ
ncbi:MAG: peptidylprolyl isomerase [Rickettsiales bacterium]|jgi:peptidyl-prolyl cis-trans isomerase C|nr:peptidylprolyl isomerase [Rickettsiales bacterium]